MSRKYKIRDLDKLYFVTFTVIPWLDVFIRREYKSRKELFQRNARSTLDYILNNPVEAGIVLSPEDYLYSSAINYARLPEKLLEVILI